VRPLPFGLGPGPTFLVHAQVGLGHALAIVGPDRQSVYFSRTGAGPGEVHDAPVLAFDGDRPAIFDMGNSRLSWWDSGGRFVAQSRLDAPLLIGGPADSGRWIATRLEAQGSLPVTIDAKSGQIHAVIAPDDSFFQAELGRRDGPGGPIGSVGRWDGGVLLANGKDYRIAGYDWQGRRRFVIAPEVGENHYGPRRLDRTAASLRAMPGRSGSASKERDRLANKPLQWFSHLAPPRLDAEGRSWVVGTKGDSVFADAWWRDRHLGRTMLACEDFPWHWQLAGDRIAMACAAPPEDSVHDRVYRIWRIEDEPYRP